MIWCAGAASKMLGCIQRGVARPAQAGGLRARIRQSLRALPDQEASFP